MEHSAYEGGGVDISVADGGHGDDHAVHALEVGQLLSVVKQRRVSVVLYRVYEPSSGPPHREEHHDYLQQSKQKKKQDLR